MPKYLLRATAILGLCAYYVHKKGFFQRAFENESISEVVVEERKNQTSVQKSRESAKSVLFNSENRLRRRPSFFGKRDKSDDF